MATSGAVNTNSYSDAYLRLEWNRTSYDSARGINYVHWVLKGVKSSSGFYWARNFKVTSYNFVTGNTTELYDSSSDIQLYDGTIIAEGDDYFTTNPNGTCKIQFNIEGAIYSYSVNCTGYDAWDLDQIPRYATSVQSLNSKTVNSIKINWSSNSTIDYIWYSKNGGNSWTAVGSVNASSGSYTITGLSPNTAYSIKTRVRRKDSQLTTDSSNLSVTTYQIAKITTANNFNLGDSEAISFSNPGGATIAVGMYKTDGTTAIRSYQAASGSSYTFNFTDTELDNLYKMFDNDNTISVRIYIRTTANNISYTDYKEATITLTGNQKTGYLNVSGTWKRAKRWTNVNGTWKRCVRWTNVDGSWERCI